VGGDVFVETVDVRTVASMGDIDMAFRWAKLWAPILAVFTSKKKHCANKRFPSH
jgi:hypothetical protein